MSVKGMRGCNLSRFIIAAKDAGFSKRSSQSFTGRELKTAEDIDNFLSRPTWNVASLLPTQPKIEETNDITPEQLRHLLRLSALPLPESSEEEARMLKDLRSQLHFVKEIQKVDTTGVEPLRSLRDETEAGEQDMTIGLEEMAEALATEEVVGKHHKRIRRMPGAAGKVPEVEDWDVLGQAPNKVGRFFVVHGGVES